MRILTSIIIVIFISFFNHPVAQQIDTSNSVPGLTQYYDYVTNGNNLKKIWVSGDTVVIVSDYTDSLNARFPTARRTYYNYTTDGGSSWVPFLTPISDTNTAYPDMIPVFLNGSRTMTFTGFGVSTGGFAGIDVQLGAGSVTITRIPAPSSSAVVSSPLSSPNIACAYARGDSLFFRKYNYSANIFSLAAFITPLQANCTVLYCHKYERAKCIYNVVEQLSCRA